MNILAIETSCDETAAAVVQNGTKIISNVVASSTKMHEKYGGIVPEVAAREQLRSIIPVITEALSVFNTGINVSMRQCINDHIDAIAVTVGPGLIGSLLVGVETAKTLSFITGKPIIPVNHVIAHIYANFISQKSKVKSQKVTFPAISLVASGGHTELYLMKSSKDLTWFGGTLDDAAGECFDKTARLLGFGHGGGLAIENAAKKCRMINAKCQIKLPRPMIRDESLNFSFSGLKTAVMREWKKCHPGLDPGSNSKIDSGSEAGMTNAFAYEIQEAITDVLVEKTLRAAKQYGAKSILLSGGVAANRRLREKFQLAISNQLSAISFFTPQVKLCTDNAVMIASSAFFLGVPVDWHEITAVPNLSVEV